MSTSSHPSAFREAWWSPWRKVMVPMYTPLSFLRRTAYHMVDASMGPCTRCQGRGGSSSAGAWPASISWCWVAI